jgi:hypothetical protein
MFLLHIDFDGRDEETSEHETREDAVAEGDRVMNEYTDAIDLGDRISYWIEENK